MNLKTCHSSISSKIFYDPTKPTCTTCPQRTDCGKIAQQRIQAQRTAHQSNASYTVPTHTNTSHVTPTRQGLAYNPLPEEDETFGQRLMWNIFGAGISSIAQEVYTLTSQWKFGSKSRRHNVEAQLKRAEAERELEELEIKKQKVLEELAQLREERRRKK